MDSNTLRQNFLDFFKSKAHTIVPSSSLVPEDDPTVLFTSAGMNQFKDNFLGRVKTLKRAASCQRCLRTADLENVGKTAGHHTFFEMLGNFSFGDYFKKEAIVWAWEFLTGVLKIKEEKLWCSVYKDDDESYGIWEKEIRVPINKIIRLGQKENFWPSNAQKDGPNGPCGPCSEIFFDQGASFGCGKRDCSPACDCGRFIEVWNLVFTQFNRKDGGLLEPLPRENIDTGMGLERLARVMQNVPTNFETDMFKDIVSFVKGVSGVKDDAVSKAISDHLRAVVFAIYDGVFPSNEARGYVVRMLIRRSSNLAGKIGIEEPFLYKMVPIVARIMRSPYPELEERRENIADIILSEEKKYKETLKSATVIMEEEVDSIKQKGLAYLPKEIVFRLYDTHGLPIEAIEEFSGSRGLKIDREGFKDLLEKQKEVSRKSSGINAAIFAETLSALVKSLNINTEFTGYNKYEERCRIKAIIKDGKPVDEIIDGDTSYVITDISPFYGEQGGQIGDTGTLEKDSSRCGIIDTKIVESTILHAVEVKGCLLKVGDEVTLKVDVKRRHNIARHHSATHLLQAALREVLGSHVEQSGSHVSDEFLRFDFSHFKDLDKREIERVEDVVNAYIRKAAGVSTSVMGIGEARRMGAIALFGEKYSGTVRVVFMGNISKELCGGTHVSSTGEIGLFKIISESNVGANLRRIEAVVGESALKSVRFLEGSLNGIGEILKTPKDEALRQVEKLLKTQKDLQKRIDVLNAQSVNRVAAEMEQEKKDIMGIRVFMRRFNDVDADFLRRICDILREKQKKFIAVLAADSQSRAIFIVSVSKELVKEGFDAVVLVKEIASIIGGSGGGRPDMAQAGGKDISKIDSALSSIEGIIKGLLT
jgi:alanyl-tRNA synthetase